MSLSNLIKLKNEVLALLARRTTLSLANTLIFSLKGLVVFTDTDKTLDLSVGAVLADLFPAGCIPLSCVLIVDTAVVTDGATNTLDLGITGGDLDAFGVDIAGAQGTKTVQGDFTVNPITLWSAASQGITVSPPGVEAFVSGVVRVRVTYLALSAFTS